MPKLLRRNLATYWTGCRACSTAQIGASRRKETEKAIDKAVDKATSKSDKDKDKKVSVEQNGDKTIINTDESEVTIEKDNSTVALDVKPSAFIGSYTQTIKITENGKDTEKPMQMTMYYDTYKTAMEMNELNNREAGAERIIFDRQYRTMTTLSIDKKGQKKRYDHENAQNCR